MEQSLGVEDVGFAGEHEGYDTGFFERLVDFLAQDADVRDEESSCHFGEVTDEAPVAVGWDFMRATLTKEMAGFGGADVVSVLAAQ